MAILRGIALTTNGQGASDQLVQLALNYLQTQQLTNNMRQLDSVKLEDIFRLMESLSPRIDRIELRRLWDLLIKLSVVRENILLPKKASHEARLLEAIQHTGRLGKFLRLVLDEATSQV